MTVAAVAGGMSSTNENFLWVKGVLKFIERFGQVIESTRTA